MYALKVDENQKEIAHALRQLGATVESLHRVGKGVPDLLVGWHGLNLLMEVKDGQKSASRQKLTPDQIEWHAKWKGRVYVVNSRDEALKILAEEKFN